MLKPRVKDIYARSRRNMVEGQLIPRGIKQEELLRAMGTVPRHLFVEEGLLAQAYSDYPLPIGESQTISQPFMVALMTEAMELTGAEKVLEIGAGSGYQAAVLSFLAERVFTIERIPALASRARKVLDILHYSNVQIRIGDGTMGWPEEAPFDAIIVTAGAPRVPEVYINQLKVGGRLVIPVGGEFMQELVRIRKTAGGTVTEDLGGCRFVKLIGKDGWKVGS